jgi:DNA-binding PucR family transcriptional regulator
MSASQYLQSIVMGLHPDPDEHAAPPEPTLPPDEYHRARDVLGPGPVDWAIRVAHQTAQLTIGQDVDDPRVPVGEIYRATEAGLLGVLEELAGEPSTNQMGRDQRDVVRLSAAHDIPFERIVDSLRLAQRQWTDLLLDQADHHQIKTILKPLLATVSRSFDRIVNSVIREYLAEQARLLDSAAARRRQTVEALVAGQPVEPALARDWLGIDLQVEHLALVVKGEASPRAPHADLQRIAALAGRLLGDPQPLLHDAGENELWAWISRPAIGSLAPLEAVRGDLARISARMGVGSVRVGAEGMRRSHLDASATCSIAGLSGHHQLLFYQHVDLAAISCHDVEAASWFVKDHLGDLAGDGEVNQQLRETLERYYESNMSLVGAAQPLHVHRNTVVHRLHRIEEILGHPVTRDVLHVRVALLLKSIL